MDDFKTSRKIVSFLTLQAVKKVFEDGATISILLVLLDSDKQLSSSLANVRDVLVARTVEFVDDVGFKQIRHLAF